MPQVLKDLFGSEKAVVALLVLIAGTVLFALGKLDAGQWKELAVWTSGIYMGTKSLQGAALALSGTKPDDSSAPPKTPPST